MSSIDRRHRGRAIRRARKRYGAQASVVLVTVTPDLVGFLRSLDRAARALTAFGRAYWHRRPILHNGGKP